MRDTPCEDTAKRARQGSAAEEERNAILALSPLIPHTQVKYDTGKKSTLCHTKTILQISFLPHNPAQCTFNSHLQESHNKKSRQILRNTHQRRHNAPRDRERRKPELRRRPLEDDVTWEFE